MISIEQSPFASAILHKVELSFGNVFLCEDIVVSEINEGVLFGLEEGKAIVQAAIAYYRVEKKVKKRVYISNRIHKYSVKPVMWLKYGHVRSHLVAYCVVDNSKFGILNALLESKFVPLKFRSVRHLDEAIAWARSFDHAPE